MAKGIGLVIRLSTGEEDFRSPPSRVRRYPAIYGIHRSDSENPSNCLTTLAAGAGRDALGGHVCWYSAAWITASPRVPPNIGVQIQSKAKACRIPLHEPLQLRVVLPGTILITPDLCVEQ
jgi:hypothetical protein